MSKPTAAPPRDRWSGRLRQLLGWSRRPRPSIAATPNCVVHRENKLTLRRYYWPATPLRFKRPILLVPSLINRHYILDLAPSKSLIEWLVQRGHDVWCVDWGKPGPEDRFIDLDDIVGTYLRRCVRVAARYSADGQVHVLGYCMGGILGAALAAVKPQGIASLIALAAPVRFDDDSLLTAWTRSADFDTEALTQATGNVPWQLLQGSFNLLRPTLPLAKLVGLVDRADDDTFVDGFVALEAWASDNVSVPGAFYRTYIDRIYRDNGLLNGGVSIGGHPVLAANIRLPTFTIAFEGDTIAPAPNCVALHEAVAAQDKALLLTRGSHVGSVVSRRAKDGLWLAIAQWCEARLG